MRVQVNSDKTIQVDAKLIRIVEDAARSVLRRFAVGITRVEVHLSDVDNRKTGKADKRCFVEVRPAGGKPVTVSATATVMTSSITQAMGKMRRALASLWGRQGKPAGPARAKQPVAPPVKQIRSRGEPAAKRTRTRAAAPAEAAKSSPRGPKKKKISQARRKAWPKRQS